MTYNPWNPDASAGQPFGAGPPSGGPPPGGFPPGGFPPGGFGVQQPPSRARIHVIWSIIAIVASLAVGTAGFVVGDSFASHRAQIDAAVGSVKTGAKAGPCSTAPVQSAARLQSFLLPPPAGSHPSPSVKIPAVLRLNAYVQALYGSSTDIVAQLQARCFQIAVHRLWVTASGSIVSIYLARFATPADARSYELFTEAGDLGATGVTGHLTLSGVSDGIAVEHGGLDKYGNTLTHLLGDRGNVVMIIHLFMPARLATSAQDRSLLEAQNARI